MITSLWFYAAAIPVIVIVGLSKGGFLSGVSILGVPLLSLVIPATEAAAILLPVLIAMDMIGVWSFRQSFDKRNLLVLLPGALIGTGLGWLTAAQVTDAHVRLIVGVIGIAFTLNGLWQKARSRAAQPLGKPTGALLGLAAGFTSFISHAGGPPVQIYLMPQRLPPAIYAGTTVMFFAVVNLLKVVPYASLGLFDTRNLATSAALLPAAALAMLGGVWLARNVPQEPFYRIANICLVIVSLELIRSGLATLLWH